MDLDRRSGLARSASRTTDRRAGGRRRPARVVAAARARRRPRRRSAGPGHARLRAHRAVPPGVGARGDREGRRRPSRLSGTRREGRAASRQAPPGDRHTGRERRGEGHQTLAAGGRRVAGTLGGHDADRRGALPEPSRALRGRPQHYRVRGGPRAREQPAAGRQRGPGRAAGWIRRARHDPDGRSGERAPRRASGDVPGVDRPERGARVRPAGDVRRAGRADAGAVRSPHRGGSSGNGPGRGTRAHGRRLHGRHPERDGRRRSRAPLRRQRQIDVGPRVRPSRAVRQRPQRTPRTVQDVARRTTEGGEDRAPRARRRCRRHRFRLRPRGPRR